MDAMRITTDLSLADWPVVQAAYVKRHRGIVPRWHALVRYAPVLMLVLAVAALSSESMSIPPWVVAGGLILWVLFVTWDLPPSLVPAQGS
jgi:hypothetical protein